jgi:hypothetical protein
VLPEPTLQRVAEEIDTFNKAEEFVETTVKNLFEARRANTSKYEVLAKVVVLNQLYSARVLNKHVQGFAEKIAKSDIDPMLDEGSPEAVTAICSCCNEMRYYSFATKYCTWHRPDLYCMWDGNMDRALWHYQERYRFSDFKRYKPNYEYPVLRRVVGEFRATFGLESINFKGIDQFLWRMGDLIKPGINIPA